MGGVDHIGQLLSAPLKTNLRNFSWKRLNFLVQIRFIIINAYIIYKSYHNITYEQFLNKLKDELLKKYTDYLINKKNESKEKNKLSKKNCYEKNKKLYNLNRRIKYHKEVELKKDQKYQHKIKKDAKLLRKININNLINKEVNY
jgi:hypothetical protein